MHSPPFRDVVVPVSLALACLAIQTSVLAAETVYLNTESEVQHLVHDGFAHRTNYVFRPAAIDDLNCDLSIAGIQQSNFIFTGPLGTGKRVDVVNCEQVRLVGLQARARVTYRTRVAEQEFYRHDVGVVNIANSRAITLAGARVENLKTYESFSAAESITQTLPGQSSCAVNVDRSRDVFIHQSSLQGYGKSVLVVHSKSDAVVTQSRIQGAYFELNVAASHVDLVGCTLYQELMLGKTRDSHAAITTSVTPKRFEVDANQDGRIDPHGEIYHRTPTKISLIDCVFDLRTGRAIVSGNGNLGEYPNLAPAEVTLANPTLAFAGPPQHGAYGLVGYSGNHPSKPGQWDSIHLKLGPQRGMVVTEINATAGRERTFLRQESIDDHLVDFVATQSIGTPLPRQGLGRFVHYQPLVEGRIVRPNIDGRRIPAGNLISDGLDANEMPF